jgi:SNF2 family DNA or RNA helicase
MTPPTYGVYGELHADGETVVLFGSGDIKQAVGRLHLLTPHFAGTKPEGGLQTRVSWPLIVQLAHEMGPSWVPGPRLQAWIYEQVQRRNVLPPLLVGVTPGAPEPYSYQIAGAQMIAAGLSSLICDDPGTGKTLTALLGIMEMRARGLLPIAAPTVVVCPNSVIDSWVAAAQRWTPLTAIAWRGTPAKRERLLDSRHDLYVVGYATARRDGAPANRKAPLQLLKPSAVVIDECHWIKNPDTDQTKAVRKLAHRAQVVIPMSGTPITHDSADLFTALNAMDKAAWPSKERYIGRYLDVSVDDYADDVLGLNRHREPEFRMTLQGQYRRLAKADVLTELPEKVYSTRVVQLPPAARKAYDQMERDMIAQLENGQELSAVAAFTQLMRLLQLSCAMADVEITLERVEDPVQGLIDKERVHVQLREPSWKIDAFMEVLEERRGKHTLAFAPSKQLMELAGARAERAGYSVGYIVGGQSPAERTRNVEAFQAGKLDVLCATTQAGGVGLTLTAASTVCFLQRPWSFVEASQAEDRAHRIGSERHPSIEIIDIVAENTVDSRVREVLLGKAGALAELLNDNRIFAQCLGGVQ